MSSEGLVWTPVKLGWLSGVSRPGSVALSPEQAALLEACPVPDAWRLRTNFPYRDSCGAFAPTGLALASGVNLARFAAASQPFVRAARRKNWRALKESCERLLLITGSCGAQIATALEARDRGGSRGGARLELLCLGAVDWRRFGGRAAGLSRDDWRGSEDGIARVLGTGIERVFDGLGHMDYLRCDAVRSATVRWVRERLEQERA